MSLASTASSPIGKFLPERILLTTPLSEPLAQPLRDHFAQAEVRFVPNAELTPEDFQWADTWVGFDLPTWLPTGEVAVKWFHSQSDGVDKSAPVLARLEGDFLLTHTIGDMPRRIGEFVLAYHLWLTRGGDLFRANEPTGTWDTDFFDNYVDPRKARVVVIGTGQVGRGVARILSDYGISCEGINTSGRAVSEFAACHSMADASASLAQADLVVSALPLTPATDRMVSTQIVSQLQGAVFMNVGRGPTVDAQAIRAGLEGGNLKKAVLDVHEVEPLPHSDWRWTDPRVFVTPHISGPVTQKDVYEAMCTSAKELGEGLLPSLRVDPKRGY